MGSRLDKQESLTRFITPSRCRDFRSTCHIGPVLYELRGIQKCKSLIILGGKIESELKIELGQFRDRPRRIAGFYPRRDSGLGYLHGRIAGLALRCVGWNSRA